MDKVLVICGPTATGKTTLGLQLADKFNGEIVSADSRQVYKYMNIGTGKDIPVGFSYKRSDIEVDSNRVGYYTNGKIRIWGYDLIDPREEFSVSDYVRLMHPAIEDINRRKKMAIVVGGSGFYIKALLDGVGTMAIKKDETLRKSLEKKDANELFELLRILDPIRSASLNASDRYNPRRLVRAIEIARGDSNDFDTKNLNGNYLFIGLKVDKDLHHQSIGDRVRRRINSDFDGEVKLLLKLNVLWSDQAMSSLGYRQWKEVIENTKAKKEVVEIWVREEINYSKRQMTWFKRDKRINWFDVLDGDSIPKVEDLVKRWHNT